MENAQSLFTYLNRFVPGVSTKSAASVLELAAEGGTVPFIARYRKEKTGTLDEVEIGLIKNSIQKFREIEKRKTAILKSIEEQGKLTDGLKEKIETCFDAAVLEDIYLPFKPKRKTKASVAREKGLEPLATLLYKQQEREVFSKAEGFITDEERYRRKADGVDAVATAAIIWQGQPGGCSLLSGTLPSANTAASMG